MSYKTHNLFKRINSMKGDAEPSSRAGGGGELLRGWFPFKPDLEASVLSSGSGKPCRVHIVCLTLALDEGPRASFSLPVRQG